MFLVAYFTCLFIFCHHTDAQSITWYEPPPTETVTDASQIRTNNIQLREGLINKQLNWKFSLTKLNVPLVALQFNGSGVATITPSTGTVKVVAAFTSRVNVSWVAQHVTLVIFNVTTSEEGVFSFVLNDDSANVWKRNIKVTVVAPPSFTNVSSNATLREGSHLLLFCKASGKPPPIISWVRISPSGSESGVLHENDTWDFKKISRNEAGTYRCAADNGVGNPVTHRIRVAVEFPPETRLQTKYFVGREKSVSLHCQVEGYPTPAITWTPCKPEGNVCDKSRLNISNVKEDGVYNCTAQNKLGSNSSITNLVIGAKVINLTLAITSEKCNEGDTSFWSKLKEPVTRLYKDKNGFTSVTLRGHRCGSLIVDLALKFKGIVSETWVLHILRNETKNGKLGELSVNPSSIAGIAVESTAAPPTTKTTKKPSDDNTVVIIVAIVVPIAAAIVVGVVLFIIWKKKKNKKKVNKEVGDKNPGGQKMKQIGGRSSDGHGNNGYENTGSSSRRPEKAAEITYTVVEQDKGNSVSRTSGGGPKKPPRSFEAETQQQSVDGRNKAKKAKKEQAQEKPVGVVYAQVDKTKKKPKKPEATYDQAERPGSKGPGDLTYAMLEHGQGSSMPRNAASQVKKPQPYVETEYAMIV